MASNRTYQLDKSDLVEHLKRQISFLERSAHAFDEGSEDEAVRSATVLRVLLHDTGSSTSLLKRLTVKERLSYVDTAESINPRNLAPTAGLVMMQFSSDAGGSYIAPLDNLSPTRIKPNRPFKPWWEEPVTKDGQGNLFSRRDYVLTASNKEGGAHVDHTLDAAYVALVRDNALGWTYSLDEGTDQPMERNPAYASVRQIAHEVDRTLRQHPLKLGYHSLASAPEYCSSDGHGQASKLRAL